MSQTIDNSFIKLASDTLGCTAPALKLLLSCLAGYPLAIIHRKLLHGKSPSVQHIFFIVTGFLLGYLNYGWDALNPLLAVTFTYVVLATIGGTSLSVAISFIGNFGYLLYGYYAYSTNDYDINWTMPHCVLVLRLIGVSFDVYDGHQDFEKLSADNKKTAITEMPTILEFYAHQFFPASFMVGPQFPLKRYLEFIEGKYNGDNGQPPDSMHYALKRLSLGILYLGIFQAIGLFVWDDYMISDEYAKEGFLKRIFLMGVWGRYTLYKYISCWLLTEGACVMFGITYNGVNEQNEIKWDGCENVKLQLFERTTEFNDYIKSFNINTNLWVAKYIFKRLRFLGNKDVSQLCSLIFLAIWHGFHSGYYLTFLIEYMVVYMERDIKSIVKNNKSLNTLFSNPNMQLPLYILLRLYTFIFMGYCLMPFALLTFDKYWKAFSAINHIGSILFIVYPFVYRPILKLIFPREREGEVNKTE